MTANIHIQGSRVLAGLTDAVLRKEASREELITQLARALQPDNAE